MAGSEDVDSERLPRWNLDPIFPGFDSKEYQDAKARLGKKSKEAETHLSSSKEASADVAAWLNTALSFAEEVGVLYESLFSYCYACYSTATRDPVATRELNAIEELGLPVKRLDVLFRNALATRRDSVLELCQRDERFRPYAFYIEDELLWQSRQLSPELEDLAADLLRSGGDAWSRLQEAISSNTSKVWDEASGERRTIVQLRNLAFDADRAIREKAYRLELEAWKGVEIPLAAALNGVKGSTLSLEGRRGWKFPLDKTIEQSRITRKALDSLIGAMEESLPSWRRYLKAKAPLVIKGNENSSCAFFDLFAPVGGEGEGRKWGYAEASSYIVDKFTGFDPEMGAFASRAFKDGWIDAEPREGKVGGAYCINMPIAKATRVLSNFDGSFSALTTVAHELGHAWHYECIKHKPFVLADYPMTLAETASIFAETVVFESAISAAAPRERLGLIEGHLQDGCQVIVDILSRFYFEQSLFERRGKAEVSSEELSALMIDAQKRSYGDALDPEKLHPYMWAVKGHYYIPSLSYYNFPYAFGLLFALGLYDRYRKEGPSFASAYRELLAESGSASAVEISRRAGFDIESEEFWRRGLSVFAKQTEEFVVLSRG